MRRIITVAALGLAGATLTACGGAPEDADKDDFCKANAKVDEAILAAFMGDSDEDKIEDALDKLEEVGTPKEIKGEAREGFEIYVEELQDIDWGADEDDLEEELDSVEDDLDDDDNDAVEKFVEKSEELCD